MFTALSNFMLHAVLAWHFILHTDCCAYCFYNIFVLIILSFLSVGWCWLGFEHVLLPCYTVHVVWISVSGFRTDTLTHCLCMFGSFVQVTIGHYHEGMTGDKYNCYRDIARVCIL